MVYLPPEAGKPPHHPPGARRHALAMHFGQPRQICWVPSRWSSISENAQVADLDQPTRRKPLGRRGTITACLRCAGLDTTVSSVNAKAQDYSRFTQPKQNMLVTGLADTTPPQDHQHRRRQRTRPLQSAAAVLVGSVTARSGLPGLTNPHNPVRTGEVAAIMVEASSRPKSGKADTHGYLDINPNRQRFTRSTAAGR
jgi:hypothetical protein